MTLVAHYSGKRLTLTVPTNAKVGDVVQKAAETLHLKKEDLPLSLLYQGNAMDDSVPLDVSGETTLFLKRCVRVLRASCALRRAGIVALCVLQVALAKMKGITAIHLVKRTSTSKTTTVLRLNNTDEGIINLPDPLLQPPLPPSSTVQEDCLPTAVRVKVWL